MNKFPAVALVSAARGGKVSFTLKEAAQSFPQRNRALLKLRYFRV